MLRSPALAQSSLHTGPMGPFPPWPGILLLELPCGWLLLTTAPVWYQVLALKAIWTPDLTYGPLGTLQMHPDPWFKPLLLPQRVSLPQPQLFVNCSLQLLAAEAAKSRRLHLMLQKCESKPVTPSSLPISWCPLVGRTQCTPVDKGACNSHSSSPRVQKGGPGAEAQ